MQSFPSLDFTFKIIIFINNNNFIIIINLDQSTLCYIQEHIVNKSGSSIQRQLRCLLSVFPPFLVSPLNSPHMLASRIVFNPEYKQGCSMGLRAGQPT